MARYNLVAFTGLAGDVYSTGVVDFANKAKKLPGIDPRGVLVRSYTEWRETAEYVKNWRDPFILGISHSYGVAAMFGFARLLGKPIPLALSVDPSQWAWMSFALWGSGGNAMPSNVKKCINFYQNSGFIGRQTIDGAENLLLTGTSHGAIEENPIVHATALDEIKKVIAA